MAAAGADKQRPLAPRLLRWARVHGRHDLPWQRPATPYRVWVSEIMLQQTQVNTVIPYFERFVTRLPDLDSLAGVDLDEVLALWSGLGYYTRARNLHRAARRCLAEHNGALPETLESLTALPGIGRSTAGAILSLGFGRRAPILDGNVKRVLARYHAVDGWPGKTAVLRRLWELAELETPQPGKVATYTQAIMDLGATLCTRTRPDCGHCPLAADCTARARREQARYPGSRPRRPRPHREARFAWIERRGQILLEQRPPSGVWGGLLCLPEIPIALAAGQWCRDTLGGEPRRVSEQAGFEHEFTHFRLRASVLMLEPRNDAVADQPMLRWMAPKSALATGLPAPIRRYIENRLATS